MTDEDLVPVTIGQPCDECGGEGSIPGRPCPICRGDGEVVNVVSIQGFRDLVRALEDQPRCSVRERRRARIRAARRSERGRPAR